MLPIKKIYIDTRHSTAESKSTSDFKVMLPSNITLPSNTAFYIIDFTVPVSWYTVEANKIVQYVSDSMIPITPPLHALFLKEIITQ